MVRIRPEAGTRSIPQELYYVIEGHGEIRIDGETQYIGPGDVVVIVPDQRHKVWPVGQVDLVLLVTCVPAYTVDEVVFSESGQKRDLI